MKPFIKASNSLYDALSLLDVLESAALNTDYTVAGEAERNGMFLVFEMLRKNLEEAQRVIDGEIDGQGNS